MKRKIPLAATLYVVLLMVPIYWLFIMSFKTNAEIFGSLTFWPHKPTLENYRAVLSDYAWYKGYLNAAIYVCMNVALSVLVAIPAAYGFSRFRFFGDRFLFFGFLALRMTAPAILLIPFVQIFSELNMIDTHLGVAIAHSFFNVPIAIWILEGFFSAIPPEIEESAKVDGYGQISIFSKILLPQIAPGIAVTAFFCFMFSWVELLLANALTTVNAKPIGAIMTRLGGVLSANVALLSAASVLTLIPGIIFVIFVRKHLARGFSLGQVN